MSWFESTKPFFSLKRGFLSSHQLSLPFAWKLRLRSKKTRLVWTCLPGMCFDRGTTKGVILTAIITKTVLVY